MICLNRRYFFGMLLIFFAVDLSPQFGAAQTSSPLVLQGGTLSMRPADYRSKMR